MIKLRSIRQLFLSTHPIVHGELGRATLRDLAIFFKLINRNILFGGLKPESKLSEISASSVD